MNKVESAIKQTKEWLLLKDYSAFRKEHPEVKDYSDEMIRSRLKEELHLMEFNNPKNWIDIMPEEVKRK